MSLLQPNWNWTSTTEPESLIGNLIGMWIGGLIESAEIIAHVLE